MPCSPGSANLNQGADLSTVWPGLNVLTGANGIAGVATLTLGAKTISTTAVSANSIIMLSPKTLLGTVGLLSVGAIVAGVSFTISSVSVLDISQVYWLILN